MDFRSNLRVHTPAGRFILADAIGVRVREVVNGEFYVTFTYPRQDGDAERYGALVEGNDVSFPPDVERGQAFRIRKVDERRQGQKVYKVVEAHHIAFTLGNYFLDSYIDFAAAKTLVEMLNMLGADTPFSFVVEGSFPEQDIFDWGEDTKIKLLQQLRQLYNAELSFDNYTITLTTRKGGNYGGRARYRHNLKGITRKSHDMERITRLYGYGKNGLTIEGYAGHVVKYIDSPLYNPSVPFMGKMEWPEIEDQARLLQEMQKYLAKYENPTVSYDVDFVQMEKIDRDFEPERIREAGDTVTVHDEDLGYSFDARAMEFEREPFERRSGRVVLANFREMKTSDYIFQATVGSKKAMEYTSKNAVLKGQKYDDSITLVDGLGMKVTDDMNRVMVRIGQTGPGEYGQTMYNKAGAKTIWQDAATGDAKFAGILEAAGGTFKGALQAATGTFAGELQAATGTFSGSLSAASGTFTGTVSAGTILGGFISGAAMDGGSITGSLIQTSAAGNYPRAEMSSTSKAFKVEGSPTASIQVLAGVPNLLYFIDSGSNTQHRQIGTLYTIQSSGRLDLNAPTGGVYINGTDVLTAIAGKANAFTGLTGSVAFLDPSMATRFLHYNNGVITNVT